MAQAQTQTQTQTQTAAPAVSAADLAFFEQNGYLVVRGLLSPAEVAVLRRRADEVAAPEREYAQRNREQRKEAELDWAAANAAQAAASGGIDGGMAMAGEMAGGMAAEMA
ncbi:MAG TPA: phytanoyl-CoA dioxygenase family protein, partial [Chloroflexota bacterium]|nr:phytanoyl-CoA dioxygenase family protein [Chloroflexota bacterium]